MVTKSISEFQSGMSAPISRKDLKIAKGAAKVVKECLALCRSKHMEMGIYLVESFCDNDSDRVFSGVFAKSGAWKEFVRLLEVSDINRVESWAKNWMKRAATRQTLKKSRLNRWYEQLGSTNQLHLVALRDKPRKINQLSKKGIQEKWSIARMNYEVDLTLGKNPQQLPPKKKRLKKGKGQEAEDTSDTSSAEGTEMEVPLNCVYLDSLKPEVDGGEWVEEERVMYGRGQSVTLKSPITEETIVILKTTNTDFPKTITALMAATLN